MRSYGNITNREQKSCRISQMVQGKDMHDIHKYTSMEIFKWQNRYYNRIIQDERQLYLRTGL